MRLTDWFDDEIEYGGESYRLDLDFYVVLTVFEILQDDELTDNQKAKTALELLTDKVEIDLELNETTDLLAHIMNNYIQLQDEVEKEPELDIMGNPMPVWQPKASYSFTHDAKYIYSSFLQAYGYDLFEMRGKLHWHKFLALFESLPSDTMMMTVISIRQRDIPTGKGSEEEAARIKRLKKQYALPE